MLESLELFRRQYLQLLPPSRITWPPDDIIRDATIQAMLYNQLFKPASQKYSPPVRYQISVLKALISKLEACILDPDEDVGLVFLSVPLIDCIVLQDKQLLSCRLFAQAYLIMFDSSGHLE